jgi:hypothetical protein
VGFFVSENAFLRKSQSENSLFCVIFSGILAFLGTQSENSVVKIHFFCGKSGILPPLFSVCSFLKRTRSFFPFFLILKPPSGGFQFLKKLDLRKINPDLRVDKSGFIVVNPDLPARPFLVELVNLGASPNFN